MVTEEQDSPNMEQQDVAAFRPQQRQQYRRLQQNFNNRGNNCSWGQGYRL